jgi:hypothetical protein
MLKEKKGRYEVNEIHNAGRKGGRKYPLRNMTQSRFFQISLFFPFVLWCLSLFFFSFLYRAGADFILDNLTNAYRVFVPYLIFAAALWKLIKNKPYRLLVLAALVVPLVWGVFFTLFYVVAILITQHMVEKWYILLIMGFWAAFVAYVLEAIPLLILAIFKDDFKADSGKTDGRMSSDLKRAGGTP